MHQNFAIIYEHIGNSLESIEKSFVYSSNKIKIEFYSSDQ